MSTLFSQTKPSIEISFISRRCIRKWTFNKLKATFKSSIVLFPSSLRATQNILIERTFLNKKKIQNKNEQKLNSKFLKAFCYSIISKIVAPGQNKSEVQSSLKIELKKWI